jgi:hypothetical protein
MGEGFAPNVWCCSLKTRSPCQASDARSSWEAGSASQTCSHSCTGGRLVEDVNLASVRSLVALLFQSLSSMARREPTAFASLWEGWKEPKPKGGSIRMPDTLLQSFSIITTEADELMSKIHPRMPVIVAERDWARWLNRDRDGPSADRFTAPTRFRRDASGTV